MRALFLTWDGSQQSYLESLFLPIFSGLKRQGVEVHVLQLTWATEQQLEPVRRAAALGQIPYEARRVPARLRTLALPLIAAWGALSARRYARRHGIGSLFPRSLIPMSMALLARRLDPSLELLFDADGFMADERIDFTGWSAQGSAYRLLRGVEAAGVRQARAVICRTEQAKRILVERAAGGPALADKIHVIPNAKDAGTFTPLDAEQRARVRVEQGVPLDAPWVCYVGSIGPQYCPEQMLRIFASIRERTPTARISCFTYHAAALKALLPSHGLEGHVEVASLTPERVPQVLAAADLGIAIRLEAPSQRGICPIKVAEYLLCGVPVVASPVGDLQAQLGDSSAALLVSSRDLGAPEAVATWFADTVLPQRDRLRGEARDLGLRYFDLANCIDRYRAAFGHGGSV